VKISPLKSNIMDKLKEVLEKDHSKKNKSELIELLESIQKVISPAEYEKVSGIKPSELSELTKKDILDIVKKFSGVYKPDWEKKLADASADVVKGLLGMAAADEALFRTTDASDAGFAAELGSIDFATIIGGPLDACVQAQNNASISTVSFIKEVGFEDGKIRMVDFSYKKSVPDPENPGSTLEESVEINVPFISILNIPSFRIETCEVDFNVKLNSTFTKNVSSEFGLNAGASGGFGPVKFKVDVSYKRTSSTGIKVEKEYSLGVKVKATNDEMPAGLEKVLGLMSQ
jgi:hypothetical protein